MAPVSTAARCMEAGSVKSAVIRRVSGGRMALALGKVADGGGDRYATADKDTDDLSCNGACATKHQDARRGSGHGATGRNQTAGDGAEMDSDGRSKTL